MTGPGVGFSLAPDRVFQARCADVIAAADYLEVMPEGLVAPTDRAELVGNAFLRFAEQHGKPLVAHGTGLSACGAHPLDADRTARWIDRARALHERLRFGWYTDHAGVTSPGGLHVGLPLAVAHTQHSRDAGRARLDALADALGVPVGLENSVFYAPLAAPEAEATFLGDVLGPRHVLLLDLHNLWTHAVNFGLDPEAWLARAPLDQVIEVHVAGGRSADPAWSGGATLHLDSHDAAVPEAVWALLDAVLPRLPALRGVTLERLEGTVDEGGGDALLGELERIRAAVARAPAAGSTRVGSPPTWEPSSDDDASELALADAWTAAAPTAALRRLAEDPSRPAWLRTALARALAHPDGVEVTRRLILRLRFDRLTAGSGRAVGWFDADPAEFSATFLRYAAEVPPTAFFPADEAALFEAWLGR